MIKRVKIYLLDIKEVSWSTVIISCFWVEPFSVLNCSIRKANAEHPTTVVSTQFLVCHSAAVFSSNQLQLTPVWKFLVIRGLFHKTSLPSKPGLFQLFWLIVTWFGFRKQNYHSSSSVTVVTYAEKLTWSELRSKLSSSNTDKQERIDINTGSLTYN